MRALSPQRRLSITKNTNYASLAHERRPSEVGLSAHANLKSISQDHATSKQVLEKIHRKSLSEMDHQRRLLERSMLAYTDKMKQLMDDKTNTIFRGIQVRMVTAGDKTGPRSLPASVELNDVPVDSAKLRKRRVLVRRPGIMTDRPMIQTPIEEERENVSKQSNRSSQYVRSTSADILRNRPKMRNMNELSTRDMRFSSPDVLSSVRLPSIINNSEKDKNKDSSAENERVNVYVVNKDRVSDSHLNNGYPTKIVEIMTKPKIHIVTEDKKEEQRPALEREETFCESIRDDSSDSAYSSSFSEEESTTDSVERPDTQDDTDADTENKSKHTVRFVEPNPEDGNLLTVPKVYKRKRKAKAKKGDMSGKGKKDTLLKKAILKNATMKS